MIITNLNEAIDNVLNIIEVENLALFNDKEVRYSDFKDINMEKIFRSFLNALSNIAFDIGLKEVEITDGKTLLIFKKNKELIIIKTAKNLVNKPLIDKGVQAIFDYMVDQQPKT
ncbi:MAG: hypothetical protein GF329_09430 [Candidatus Lokiarchaeota archaeon]|nr:hypothetical protein [Candidatus Lokiarchaeota archaeon]